MHNPPIFSGSKIIELLAYEQFCCAVKHFPSFFFFNVAANASEVLIQGVEFLFYRFSL